MLKNDLWINQKASEGMIEPFQSNLVRHLEPDNKQKPVLSYGCSSYGYDLRLSSKEFLIFRHVPGTVMNPKKFNPNNLEKTILHHDDDGDFFILPAHSYGLGVALEKMKVPENITVICIGKSTYARLGIIVNTTPAEAGWEGHLTLSLVIVQAQTAEFMLTRGYVSYFFLKVILALQHMKIDEVNIKINREGNFSKNLK